MKLKKEHFELFKKECLYWLDKFHLNEYDVYFEFKEINNDAENILNQDGNITFALCTEIDSLDKNIGDYIKVLAKHETIHCLLGRYMILAEARYVQADELNMELEHLVRKLTKII